MMQTLTQSKVAQAPQQDIILEVRNLKKYFRVGRTGVLKAVDNVSFFIRRGETLGLVGESGCGKSTTGRTIIRLYDATDGEVLFKGKNVHKLKGAELKRFRREMQMIFQDPYASLNPRMTVADIIAEGLDIHGLASGKERMERVYELLETVGLNKEHASRFPHEFSGGQRQRIGIARALAVEPDLLIADECVSALDVSVQAQVLDLLREIRDEMHLAMLFITHDLRVASQICDRVIVLHRGKIVEEGEVSTVFSNPQAPYTRRLIDSVPGRSWHEPASVHEV